MVKTAVQIEQAANPRKADRQADGSTSQTNEPINGLASVFSAFPEILRLKAVKMLCLVSGIWYEPEQWMKVSTVLSVLAATEGRWCAGRVRQRHGRGGKKGW